MAGKLRVGLMPYLNSAVFYNRMATEAVELTEYVPREMALALERQENELLTSLVVT